MAITLQELLVKVGADIREYTGGLDEAIKKGEEAGSKLEAVGGILSAGVTVPLAAIAAGAIHAWTVFDEASDKIRAATGATGEALKGLERDFSEVFKQVPSSAADASAAIAGLHTRLGLVGEPLQALSIQLLNFTKITGSELAPLVPLVTRLFGDWSIETANQSTTLDELYRVTQTTGIGLDKLSELVVQFGAPLRAFGFDLESAALLMGKWEKEGVNLETVLSGMRFALGKFAEAGKDPKIALEQVIDSIKNAGTESQATAIAFDTFGKRAAIDMSRAIIEGRFNLDQLRETLRANHDTINQAAKDTYDFSENWKIFQRNLEEALVPLGTVLVNALTQVFETAKPLLSTIKSLGEWFGKLAPNAQVSVVALAGLAAAAGPLLIAVDSISSGVTAAVAGFGALAGSLTVLGPLAIAFGLAIAGWAIYESVTQIQNLNKELDRLYNLQQQGIRATTEQAQLIGVLETVLRRAGKEVDSTGMSVGQYVNALKEAVSSLEDFKDKQIESGTLLKGHGLNLAAAAKEYLGLGEAQKKITEATAEGTEARKADNEQIQRALEKFNLLDKGTASLIGAYATLNRAYESGQISAEAFGKVQQELGRIQEDIREKADELRQAFSALEINEIRMQIVERQRYDDLQKRLGQDVEIIQGAQDLTQILGPLIDRIQRLDRANRDLAIAMQTVGASINPVLDALKLMGIASSSAIEKQAVDFQKAYETIRDSGTSTAREVTEAWIRAKEAQIKLARDLGEEVSKEDLRQLEDAKRDLEGMTEVTGIHTRKQASLWETLGRQVSTIFSDFGRNFADMLKALVVGDPQEKQLRQQEEQLRESLTKRTADWQSYQDGIAGQEQTIRLKFTDALSQGEADLQKALDDKTSKYEQFVSGAVGKFEELRAKNAEKLDQEITDLRARLAEKQADYDEYVKDVAEKLSEIRKANAEDLEDDLQQLRENLAQKSEAYDRYVEDTNNKLRRIGEDLAERLEDVTRSTNRRIQDENKDFGRDTEDLNKKLREAELAGDKKKVEEIKLQLRRRQEDHGDLLRRLREDLQEATEDSKRQAERQTADLKAELSRRTADWREAQAEFQSKITETTLKHAQDLAKQEAALSSSLQKRTADLEDYRIKTESKIETLTARYAEELAKEEKALHDSLETRQAEFETYKTQTAEKLEALRVSNQAELDNELAALQKSNADKLAEYDQFKTDTDAKLKELEDAHKGPLDRIKDLFVGLFDSASEALLRFAGEEVMGVLFRQLSKLAETVLPNVFDALDSVLGGALSGVKSAAKTPTGGAPGSAATTGATSGLAGIVTAVGSAVSAITGVIGAFQMHGMGVDLGRIEESTRKTEIGMNSEAGAVLTLRGLLANALDITRFWWETFLPAFQSLMTTTETIQDQAKNFYSQVLGKEDAANVLTAGDAAIIGVLEDSRAYVYAIWQWTTQLAPGVIMDGLAAAGRSLQQIADHLAKPILTAGQVIIAGGLDFSPIINVLVEIRNRLDTLNDSLRTTVAGIAEILRQFATHGPGWIPTTPAPTTTAKQPVSLTIYLDGRTLATALVEDITAMQGRQLKVAGQLV